MTVGGSLESVSIRGREFAVAADADVSYQLGGMQNEKQANGDGTTRTIQTRVPWAMDGLTVTIDHDRADLEFLQEIADSGEDVAIAATFASGAVYAGRGTITGEIQGSSQSATAGISLSGPGKLEQQ